MPTVETETVIDAPADVVFDLSQNYRLRLSWDPFLRALRPEGGDGDLAAGNRVWVRARNGLTMIAEYVTVDRPRRVAIRMVSRSLLFARFAGSWSFEPCAPGRTRVVFRYGFETRWRLFRPLLDRVVARVFERDVGARLVALKRRAETISRP